MRICKYLFGACVCLYGMGYSQSIVKMEVLAETVEPLLVTPGLNDSEISLDELEQHPVVILQLSEKEKSQKIAFRVFDKENQLLNEGRIRLDGKKLPDGCKVEFLNGTYRLTLGAFKNISTFHVDIELIGDKNEVLVKREFDRTHAKSQKEKELALLEEAKRKEKQERNQQKTLARLEKEKRHNQKQ